VNPGNCPGLLPDSSAAIIGVVTLWPDQSDGRSAEGLAFALPSNAVVPALRQLERYGKVSHPQMGVQLGRRRRTGRATGALSWKVSSKARRRRSPG
jgi:serine protease Do